ncbi:MAG: hypothetical protein ACMVY4_10725 [Minwuia sp.]
MTTHFILGRDGRRRPLKELMAQLAGHLATADQMVRIEPKPLRQASS